METQGDSVTAVLCESKAADTSALISADSDDFMESAEVVEIISQPPQDVVE